MIQESSADKRQNLYLYTDEGSYEPLARIDRNGNQEQHIYYFHTDLNGMPEELTDEAGEIVWECSYQLWGKPIQEIAHTEIQQNQRYQGQYLDRETGLHYNTFRYYDPDIGRFTQPDPIGLRGGYNLYQYAPNAFMWIDPWGLNKKFSAYCAFGNAKKPRGPRPDLDIPVDSNGMVRSQAGKEFPEGASVLIDTKLESNQHLNGHYYTIPEGTPMPDGLGIKRDGPDVIDGSTRARGHATIYPTRDMSMDEFKELFDSLPWKHGGNKKKRK
ncbi:RHS repeat-associated core domain-containing protein [Snodgrassella alvi]|uniref:RHS repeat-associated core domain-containing protein n=1 Tax=Snodgrassella alvi TaxID=1196083 RepID=UPI00351C07D8